LKWTAATKANDWIVTSLALPNEFYGAQPEFLQTTLPSIAQWLTAVKASDEPGSAAHEPLARVRHLWNGVKFGVPISRFARVLRAAPQLRRLTVEFNFVFETSDEEMEDDEEEEDAAEGEEEEEDPALAEVVHPRLRHLAIDCFSGCVADEVADWVVMLQERYFPRLRRFTVDDQDFPVSATEVTRMMLQDADTMPALLFVKGIQPVQCNIHAVKTH
jgi:hypothetical protein